MKASDLFLKNFKLLYLNSNPYAESFILNCFGSVSRNWLNESDPLLNSKYTYLWILVVISWGIGVTLLKSSKIYFFSSYALVSLIISRIVIKLPFAT